MGAPTETDGPSRTGTTWLRHLGSAALGIALVMAIEAVTRLEQDLRAVQLRDAVPWPSWAIAGMFLLVGAVLVVVVLVAPRLPWLPTAAALALCYGMLATLPGGAANTLPYLGQWAPSVHWGLSTIALVAGLMTATAAWGWWSCGVRRAARRHAAAR